jgi:hypothetical protein
MGVPMAGCSGPQVDHDVPGSRFQAAGAGQVRVDAIQAAIRGGEAFPATSDPALLPLVEPVDYAGRIALELDHVKGLLDTVGLALADDIEILTRHEQELQKFDLAVQILDHLQTIISSDDPAAAISRVPMRALRSRLLGIHNLR